MNRATDSQAKFPRMVLAGGSGFLGCLLAEYFGQRGWDVVVLTRDPSEFAKRGNTSARAAYWDGRTLGDWRLELEDAKVLINLAGKSVNCRYHKRNRRKLMDSRKLPTRILGEAVRACKIPPQLWMNASTATLYRHTYGEPWGESGEIGAHPDAKDAFSIRLATEWEETFLENCPRGVRLLLLRSAMVLGSGNDANNVFSVLRRLTRFGLGGTIASGDQFVSWIHEVDFCQAIEWLIDHPQIEGPVNLAAPNPEPNRDMMRIFREVFQRLIGLPAPLWLLEIGTFFMRTESELVIKSRRVIPEKLKMSGFRFKYQTMREAVDHLASDGQE